MQTLFRAFLKLLQVPGKLSLNIAFHTLMLITGVGLLYLLTLREDEEGRIQDYLLRLWNRMSTMRERALSLHLAIINVTARSITSTLNKLFGPSLFSLRATGVSASLALFFLHSYYFVAGLTQGNTELNVLGIALLFVCFALFPAVLEVIRPTKHSGSRTKRKIENQGWLFWWGLLLVTFIFREHASPVTCVSCVPAKYRGFFFSAMLMLTTVAIVGSALFIIFVILTRFSLKRLSTSNSTSNSILFLLIGCLPVPVFWLLLKLMLLILDYTLVGPPEPNDSSNITTQEWVGISSIVVFALSFSVNLVFLLAPIVFF